MWLAQYIRVAGKLGRPTRVEASKGGRQRERRLIITDATSRMRYLVDSGANVSVLPRRAAQFNPPSGTYRLFAANGSPIVTYGETLVAVDLGQRRKYSWIFIVADVTQAILGADFLAHHNLLIDFRRRQLVDDETRMGTVGQLVRIPSPVISTIDHTNQYGRPASRVS